MSDRQTEQRPRLFGLLRRVPELISRLIRDEVAAAKAEVAAKIKAAGLGASLTAGGITLGLFAFGALVTSAIAGLDLVLPHWLSALIVALVLLVAAAILALVGIRRLKAGMPPVPAETIDSVKADVRVMKGTAR